MTQTRWDKLWEKGGSYGIAKYTLANPKEWHLKVKAEGDRMQKKLQAVEKAMLDGMEVLTPP